MDIQDLLNDTGDVRDDLTLPTPPVPAPEKLLKIVSDEIHLGLLHSEIKCSASVPLDPTFKSIPRAQPRPFQLCLPAGFKASPLAFFKLFFTEAMFNVLVENTNLYAKVKKARTTPYGKGRRWYLISLRELSIWIALHIYIRLCDNSNIEAYWITDLCIHQLMQHMSFYQFEQIKRYFHVSSPTAIDGPIDY
jgi:hypothetical protein